MFALEDNHSSRRRPRVAVAVLSAMALAGVAAIALRHSPSPTPEVLVPQATTTIHCGDVITASIVVGNDLTGASTCTSGDGLRAGRAGITINLNGHTLAGAHGAFGFSDGSFAVTIENGTLSGWEDGVIAFAATKVIGVRATANSIGIALHGAGASATGNVAFSNDNFGIEARQLNQKLTSNVVRENAIGILLGGATGAVVQTNQVENNTGNGIDDTTSAASFTGNIANGNGGDGIKTASDSAATVTSNTANYNGAFGIEAAAGGKDGGGNKAKDNTQAAQCKDVVCS